MNKRIKDSKIWKYSMVGLLTCCCIWAFSEIQNIQGKLTENTNILLPLLLLVLVPKLLMSFLEMKQKRKIVIAVIGGSFFSLTYVMGNYLHYKNQLPSSYLETGYFLFLILFLSVVTIPTIALILESFRKMAIWYEIKQREHKLKYTESKVVLFSWLMIFLCWLPMFLTNWPSNFIFDAKYQIQEVINFNYHTHHPLLHTYLMGLFYRLGISMGNVSLGFSFYTLLQMLTLSYAGSRVVGYFYKKQTPKMVCIGFLGFYALVPVHAIFSITATKDVLFAAFFLLFMIGIFSWFMDHKEFSKMQMVEFVLSGVLMVLFCNNAIFALLLIAPFFVFFSIGKMRRIKMFVSLLGIAGGYVLVMLVMGILLNAYTSDSLKETFSVPLQQMARVASYRTEDVSEELYQEIVEFIPEENIARYNPYLSDPIKNEVNEVYLRENVSEFFVLWLKVGAEYPGEYTASFFTNTMGFWYLGNTDYAVCEEIASYHTLIGTENEIVTYNYGKLFQPINTYLFEEMQYRTIPILRHFFKPALYFWILVLTILYAIYTKKNRNILAMGLLITYFLSVFLGPISTLRYVYCIVVCLPFMLGAIFETRN